MSQLDLALPAVVAPEVRRANRRYALLAVLALLPGLAVFGTRAAAVVIVVLLGHALAARFIRPRQARQRIVGVETGWIDALLLCALLPAEAAGGSTTGSPGGGPAAWLWPVCIAAPLLLALLRRLRAAAPHVPFDAVVVTAVLLHATLGTALMPRASLNPDRLFRGDVLHAQADSAGTEPTPWYARPNAAAMSAQATPWAAERLDAYLSRRLPNTNLDSLIRDELPPIEDLVLLGHPTLIGMASGVCVLALVLWGAFHRTIDWRMPLVAIAACYVTLLVLPVPTSVSATGLAHWRLAAAWRAEIGPATALTFMHYLLFASPALFTLGLLAPRGDSRPVQPHAVLPWSFVIGVLTATLTLYVSVMIGPLLAILAAPAGARLCDRLFAQRPMHLPS